MQRQLLPAGLPVLPCLGVSATYLLADAGGDWFDAVPAPGGRLALIVGDVVGHGVPALAAMGQLRAVLHDRLDETGDIPTAIAAADRTARRMPGARAATVCIVLLDPADGTLTWCSAGHPPPLIATAEAARFLPAGQGPLATGAAYRVRRDRLDPGEVLLLYSDGLIERPGRSPAAATAELAQVVRRVIDSAGIERVCTQTLEQLVSRTGHTDDITLLAAQRRVPAPPLRLGGPGSRPSLALVRTAVDAWLTVLQAGEDDRVALTHAAVELVTNAFEHARPGSTDVVVTVTAELADDGECRLAVADDGRWRPRTRPGDEAFRKDHGYGLAMAASFADHLDVAHDDNGTRATVRRRLSRPAGLLTTDQMSAATARRAARMPELMLILDQPGAPTSRIAVHGALDAGNVEELGLTLDRYTLGGTHQLVVDLTAVTHLASAAVAELYRTRPGMRLYAPPGSTAQHVLTLVDLPHTTSDPDGK